MFQVKGTKGRGTVTVAVPTAASAIVTAKGLQTTSFDVMVLDPEGQEMPLDELAKAASGETRSEPLVEA